MVTTSLRQQNKVSSKNLSIWYFLSQGKKDRVADGKKQKNHWLSLYAHRALTATQPTSRNDVPNFQRQETTDIWCVALKKIRDVFVQKNRNWKAQWFILLTGSGGFLWDAGHVFFSGRVCSCKVGAEDVIYWRAFFTEVATVRFILSRVGVVGVVAWVDICWVSSVFSFLDISAAITVNNTWEKEGRHFQNLTADVFWVYKRVGIITEDSDFKAIFLFFFLKK